jgi:superfamily II DNA helicase RecQ
LVSATSDIEIPRYTRVVNPTILDFIPENVRNESFDENGRFERKRQNRKFIQLDLFIEISVGYCFFNHRDAAERISDTLNEKEFTYYHGGMDQDERDAR